MVAEVGVRDSAGEVLAAMDSVGEVLAHRAQVLAGAALVRDLAGRVDLRIEGFLVGEITVASVIVVSVGGIAAFAIAGFAMLMVTLSTLASMALDIQITTSTTIRITMHTRITTHIGITTIGVDSSGDEPSPRSREMVSVVQSASASAAITRDRGTA
jgi:hypothetical protein